MKSKTGYVVLFIFLVAVAIIFSAGIKVDTMSEQVQVQEALVRYEDTGWGWFEARILSNDKFLNINSVDMVESKEVWMKLKPGDLVVLHHYWIGWNAFGKIWEWKHEDKLTQK